MFYIKELTFYNIELNDMSRENFYLKAWTSLTDLHDLWIHVEGGGNSLF